MTSERAIGPIGWRGVAAVVALASLVGAACGDGGGGDGASTRTVGQFEATSDYLSQVADATEGLSYRVSMDMTMGFSGDGDDFDAAATVMNGEVDGDRSSMTMDMGELFADLPGARAGDQSLEFVTDGTTTYVRGAAYASLAQTMLDGGATQADLGPLADLAELDDEWGRVDTSQISLSELGSMSGGQSVDPRAYLEMAADGTDVHELDEESIDGVGTRGLGATITYGDVLEASGVEADDVREQFSTMFGGMAGGEEGARIYDAVIDEMFAAPMPVEVRIDDDDHVRSIALDMNMAEIMAGVAEQLGEEPLDMTMSTTMTMNFSDYGDESIEIEVPEASRDVTDAFEDLIAGGGLGGAGGSLPSGGSTSSGAQVQGSVGGGS